MEIKDLHQIWNPITTISDLDSLVEDSKIQRVLIFKHSTRCIISKKVIKEFENKIESIKNLKCFYLDLINHKDISSEIASRFSVVHQSPQVIVINNGEVVLDASHDNILGISL